jgi:hypothetical protein
VWRSANPPYSPDIEGTTEFKEFLGAAVASAEDALAAYTDLPAELQALPECVPGIRACRSNVAYFLATAREEKDHERALSFIEELDPSRWQSLDTIAWVRLRCSEPDDKIWKQGIETLTILGSRRDVPTDVRTKIQAMYSGLFADRSDVQAALQGGTAS